MQRLSCERYPCHFEGQDCSLCFCPFYPCHDKRTGGRCLGGAWSCEGCTIVHRDSVASAILDALLEGGGLAGAWRRLERLL
ncbi:MAG: cysteine-rich small domain-containing protein [Methanothrix sp.]|nr:cysteine-rich small domain-containing protein [Methanothrix sp.]